MHLLVRDARTLDGEAEAADLGHAPADLVLLSFSDADLGAAAAAWQTLPAPCPTLRLVNLAALRHPMSVDVYAEQVIAHARCVVLRLLGGLEYWPYGAQEVSETCRSNGVALAVIPGDVRDDARLLALSTVPPADVAALDTYFRQSGPDNVRNALQLAAHLGGLGPRVDVGPQTVAAAGQYVSNPSPLPPPSRGAGDSVTNPLPLRAGAGGGGPRDVTGAYRAAIVFYRSHLLSGDTAPIDALAAALAERGFAVRALYAASLKDPDAASSIAASLRGWQPHVVLNATGFSASQGGGSPLDAAGCPVLQVILTVGGRDGWAASPRGVSQTDLAMQVVLPELDGRLLTTAVSFKAQAETVPGLDFVRTINRPDPDGIALAADRALGWARLAATRPEDRRVAIVLSDYPGAGGGQVGHAVGLDTFASLHAIRAALAAAGYTTALSTAMAGLDPAIHHALTAASPAPILTLAEYRSLFATLPQATQSAITAAWGGPEDDPAVTGGQFTLRHAAMGHLIAAVQPGRGHPLDRKSGYHSPDLPPRHAYVAFYLWLRHTLGIHALVHLGTHGTLEWLPGKAAALSAACAPVALAGGVPVIYPFIVNNPGEAAAAKRRLGAVTIGHLTPPLRAAGTHGAAAELERLIDEFAAADGLDRRRTSLLRREILDRADSCGLLAESGVPRDAPEDEALARLDAWLCDVKDLQIRDGLHVFGQAPRSATRTALLAAMPNAAAALDHSPQAEMAALLAALDGKFVAPGPAGAPTRGRADVLPTGRNLFTIDPRAVPTRSALVLAEKAAADLIRRHLQDHGDWPRALVVDLWGSATMRTGGEDFALALLLMGVRPLWDEGSARVSGIDILPLALLDRPRVDVTLRISGLFRDAFESQIALFDAAVRAIAARDEAADFNPLAAAARGLEGPDLRRATARIYGNAPGDYGAGVAPVLERGAWQAQAELGDAYLAASAHAYGRDLDGAADAAGFAARVAAADVLVHTQDHAETDLLDSPDYAAHEGGFAAAAAGLGAAPALYHLDTSRPDAPRARLLAEEIARVVRGRAANPVWIAGQMRHGYRGASEIARSLDSLHAFAATLPQRLDAQFDLLFDATLGDAAVDRFLRTENPAARAAMAERFRDALARGLWRSRRNSVAERLAA